MLIDVHCHLTDDRWYKDIDQVLMSAKQKKITGFGMGGYSPDDWTRQKDLTERFSDVQFFSSVGLHPVFVSQINSDTFELYLSDLHRWTSFGKMIGEVGLDGRSPYQENWVLQMEAFRSQLEVAWMYKKKVIFHIVRSFTPASQLLSLYRNELVGGYVHAFSGQREEAKFYLDLNLSLSFGGELLNPRSHHLREIVRWIPSNKLLIETDSPDHRIKSSISSDNSTPLLHSFNYLWDIANLVGELRGITGEDVLKMSTDNFLSLIN